ncbi:MAG: RnfABCDGE type electron transport complex subunit D [Gammaproteobacteria bacterium]|nr:RnfABCDGE type electron transport complex subunit D [Gammaproteobacteria bacterium]
MADKTGAAPHWHDGSSVSKVMADVCLALVPGLLCYAWLFGPGVLIQCILAVTFALLFEWALLRLRRRNPAPFLRDGSAVVTALLFALSIPPAAPWWVCLCGIAFAIILCKHVFGGVGYNIFNPAMAGFAFVLICFPVPMNTWPQLSGQGIGQGMGAYLRSIFPAPGTAPDILSGATPLDELKSRLELMEMVSEINTSPLFGYLGGAGWEWVNLLLLLGGGYLLLRGVIKWQIPVAVLTGIFLGSSLLHLYDPNIHAGPLFHLFSGGAMLCAFFIATDPVTAPTTRRGRLLYGALIGLLICLLRNWGVYPDGVAFAVLLANIFVPLIDLTTRPDAPLAQFDIFRATPRRQGQAQPAENGASGEK